MAEKHAAAYHGSETHTCPDCGANWASVTAANECELLDQIEARNARRPVRPVMRAATYWEDE